MKIGITGIFASGKGTISAMFGELGAIVIDTDIIVRELQSPGSECLDILAKEFGQEILNCDSSLNRQALSEIVFRDPDKVKKLNSIIHPMVHNRITEIIEKAPDQTYAINVPLLFESGLNKLMDCNILVCADEAQVIERGIKRDNISEDQIRQRLKYQISLNEKKKLSDYVIDNSGTLTNTKRQVEIIWKTLHQEKERN